MNEFKPFEGNMGGSHSRFRGMVRLAAVPVGP